MTDLIYPFYMPQTEKIVYCVHHKPVKWVYDTLQIQQPFSRLLKSEYFNSGAQNYT